MSGGFLDALTDILHGHRPVVVLSTMGFLLTPFYVPHHFGYHHIGQF
jgi:hypothetical protein